MLKRKREVKMMNNLEYEIKDGKMTKMTSDRINLHKNGYVSTDDGILIKDSHGTKRYLDQTKKSNKEGERSMEISQKEYVDQRIDNLEKSIDFKFSATENLLSEKIDHLHTKLDASLESKFNSLKSELSKDQTESKRFLITTAIAVGSIATAIIIGGVSIVVTLIN